MNSQLVHDILRASHIGFGSLALVLFWIPAFARKGSRLHVISGRWFSRIAFAVAITATASCAWAIFAPTSFTGITRELTTDESARLVGSIRYLFIILLTLTTWLVASVVMGVHVSRNRVSPCTNPLAVRASWWISGGASLICGFYGVLLVSGGDFKGLLPIFLTWVGVSDSRKNLHFISEPITSEHAWIGKHIESMIGAGIAMHTAFFVFGFKQITPIPLSGGFALLPWVLPVALGAFAIHRLTKKYGNGLEAPNSRNAKSCP